MIKSNNCEICGKEENDGTWIRKNGTKKFHYICYRCIEPYFNIIENKIKQ